MGISGRSSRATTAMENCAHMTDPNHIDWSAVIDTKALGNGMGDFSLAPNGDMF